MSRIIKFEVWVFSQSQRLMLQTLTETLIILDITRTESNNAVLLYIEVRTKLGVILSFLHWWQAKAPETFRGNSECTKQTSFSRLLSIHFNFFPNFFPKFEFPNLGCGWSVSAAYMPLFTVIDIHVYIYTYIHVHVCSCLSSPTVGLSWTHKLPGLFVMIAQLVEHNTITAEIMGWNPVLRFYFLNYISYSLIPPVGLKF